MNYLGIDLSKAYFDATLQLAEGRQVHQQFANDPRGFAQLDRWLRQQQGTEALHVCMEATNIYWEALAEHLHAAGHTVSVVNPARIKGFAMSQLRRNKTDKLDSQVIAAFCASQQPAAWQPPSAAERQLRARVRHRQALIKTRTQQKNRLADCTDEAVRASLQRLIEALDSEISQVEQQISQLIAQEPTLRERKRLLSSITGLGPVAVHTIMAEMYDLADYTDAHAAAADAGVHPRHHESGSTIRRRATMSKQGKAAIRSVLYFPALTAMRHNPLIQAFVERLRRRNKPTMVIIGAVMRKLIHLAYGVLKNRTPFDPEWGQRPAPAT